MTMTLSRTQRLRTLENDIRKAAEQIQKNGLQIGRDLIEIRDDELWKAEGFESWNQYLKERGGELVGKSFTHAANLMSAAEVERRLPDRISPDVRTNLTASHLSEISRLAPVQGKNGERGADKNYSALRKQDIARVLQSAAKLAGGESPSVRDVRKAVDVELGIDRVAKAAATKEKNDAGVELADYLRQCLGRVEGITNNLAKVPGESWKLLEESEPMLIKRLVRAVDSLAELLRS